MKRHVSKKPADTMRSGLDALEDTLRTGLESNPTSPTNTRSFAASGKGALQAYKEEESAIASAQFLMRVVSLLFHGDLRINGQVPDQAYALGEYLMHGGRVRFDLSHLTETQREEFWQFLCGPSKVVQSRAFASHGEAAGLDADGRRAEIKLKGAVAAAVDGVKHAARRLSDDAYTDGHYGVNIAVGGYGATLKGEQSTADGQWGHVYIYKGSDMIMLGIENSAPGMTDKIAAHKHDLQCKTSKISSFQELKIGDPALAQQQGKGLCPLSVTGEKYNWASCQITPTALQKAKREKSIA